MKRNHFVFISTDDRGKTKRADRQLIRSQCMHGKNHRTMPLWTRAESAPAKHQDGLGKQWSSAQRQAGYQASQQADEDRSDIRRGKEHEERNQLHMTRPPYSDVSILADNTDTQARLHLFHFFTHASHLLYPVDLCADFDLGQSSVMRWLFEDTTYLHFVLFFTSAINDAFLRRPFGKTACYHMGQTITSLNKQLARSELHDSTISVVSSLVIVCAIFTDYDAAEAHFRGLQQMVRLRGGLKAFRHNLGLYIKLARVDLAYALHTGRTPLFTYGCFLSGSSANTTASIPHYNYHVICGENNYCSSSEISFPSSMLPGSQPPRPTILDTLLDDNRVAAIFSDLQHLSWELNRKRRLQDPEFKVAISSIQYRLLLLKGTVDGMVSECLRLAMLVFLTTTFEIPEIAGQRYPYLTRQFRESCCKVLASAASSEIWKDFITWILLIGGVSLYGVDEDWICEHWRKVVPFGTTWHATRNRVKRILWIDKLDDDLGKRMFDAMNGDDREEMAARRKCSAWWVSGWGMCPLEM